MSAGTSNFFISFYVTILNFHLSATRMWHFARRLSDSLQIRPSAFTQFDIRAPALLPQINRLIPEGAGKGCLIL